MSYSANIDDVVLDNHNRLLGKHSNWERVRLRDVASILNGFPFQSSRFSKTDGIPLIRIRDILPGKTETYYQGEVDDTFLVKQGDILVGMDGDFNCAQWSGEPALLNQRVCKITPKEEFYSNRFLLYALPGYLSAINDQTSSVTVKHLSSRTVENIPLPLPPRAEQDRIVSKLDSLFSQLASGEAAARRGLERLERYRAAVLHAAVTGELTREWRKKHKPKETGAQLLKRLLIERRTRWEAKELKRLLATGKPPQDDNWKKRYSEPANPMRIDEVTLPSSWCWSSPEQISEGTQYSLSIGPFGSNLKVSDYRQSGVPIIFVRNIRSEDFSFTNSKFVSKSKAEKLSAHQVLGGDLLITKMGDPPGDACIYPEQSPNAIITSDCIRLHLSKVLHSSKRFFVHSINSRLGREQIQRITSGVAQQKVSLARFSGIALPIPPLAEQIVIKKKVDRHLSAINKLEKYLKHQLIKAQVIRQSLLREAFCGNLVPQNSMEEPAFVLLERILSNRAAHTIKSKVKHMPRPKSKASTYSLIDLIKEHFEGNPFTFETLRKKAQAYEYENLKNELYALLRPVAPEGVSIIQMVYNTKKEQMEFKLQRP